MDYKAFEEMTGGIPEKTEMDKLIGYLKIFPPVKYTYSIVKFCGRPQVIFMDACTDVHRLNISHGCHLM